MTLEEKRQQILALVRDYAGEKEQHAGFVPGQDAVPPSGKVLDAQAYVAMVDAALDGWLTTGRFNDEFETELAAKRLGVAHALTCNSRLIGQPAGAFRADLAPAGRARAQSRRRGHHRRSRFPDHHQPNPPERPDPVFVDSALPAYNPTRKPSPPPSAPRTRAIMLAHTPGQPDRNPPPCAPWRIEHGLWLIEDCCDALRVRPMPAATSAPTATSAR
jgi:CDP-6-deoxy-D-xylo-4-hexulose-3-dehydrase